MRFHMMTAILQLLFLCASSGGEIDGGNQTSRAFDANLSQP
jgi:hypothetical protein